MAVLQHEGGIMFASSLEVARMAAAIAAGFVTGLDATTKGVTGGVLELNNRKIAERSVAIALEIVRATEAAT